MNMKPHRHRSYLFDDIATVCSIKNPNNFHEPWFAFTINAVPNGIFSVSDTAVKYNISKIAHVTLIIFVVNKK